MVARAIDTRQLIWLLAQHLRNLAIEEAPVGPTSARHKHTQLRGSIEAHTLSDTEAVVGTNLHYARAVHDGAVIRPKRAKALVFPAPAGWGGPMIKNTNLAVARKVTIKPNPYLARAAARFASEPLPPFIRERVGEDVARALEANFKRLGLEVKRS
ncbi:hypothetical protein EDC61_11485 [Sulfuritortus calidifontis]|uniref:HK97 gp10 family phage protein n=1 Tax=Sulfuritortus calidifontis TaxID=1914471 RepID=A0A4R3JVH7_9PROT|nr:hypothetical protein [Sulfuritortus calidifontis]TCS70758.1 hypothetical protein EDC61_11485 [Sulfuritortus calidifontis]